jgi:hypothetical protein
MYDIFDWQRLDIHRRKAVRTREKRMRSCSRRTERRKRVLDEVPVQRSLGWSEVRQRLADRVGLGDELLQVGEQRVVVHENGAHRAETCPQAVQAPAGDLVDFRSTVLPCGNLPSARRHGVTDDDILHAIEHSMVVDDLGEDPDRWLVIGPDRAANLLEVVVLITAEGDELIIHAMPLRDVYRKLLDP